MKMTKPLQFLQLAVKGKNAGINPIHIDVWDMGSAELRREWHNIDIFVRDEVNRARHVVATPRRGDEDACPRVAGRSRARTVATPRRGDEDAIRTWGRVRRRPGISRTCRRATST